MNPIFFAAFLSLGVLVSGYAPAYGHNDGQWKGEGLAESQDNAHFHNGYATYAAPHAYSYGAYAHGAAPIGHDGRVVDTPEVAHAKAAHYAAKATASQGQWAHAEGAYAPATYAAWSPVQNDGQWKGEGLIESQDKEQVNQGYYAHAAHVAAYAPALYSHGNDGQWKGEGLIESQDNSQYNGQYNHYSSHAAPLIAAYAPAHYAHENDGQWKGEGLIESQDNSQHNAYNGYSAYGSPLVQVAAYAPSYYSHENDGQWKGEGLIESQDNSHYGSAYATYGAYASPTIYSHGVYAHGAAPIGIDGRVVDTLEVAHAKAAHYAAKAAVGAHGSW